MGNKQSNELKVQNIISQKELNDSGYGSSSIVSFSNRQEILYVRKKKPITSQKQAENFMKCLEYYERCNPNLVVELIGRRYENGLFCSFSNFIEAIFQYIPNSLKKEIESRKQTQTPFKQKDLLSLITNIVESCREFTNKGIQFQFFNPDTIAATSLKQYKLNLSGMMFEDEIHLEQSYIPPQNDKNDDQKCKIFILGMIAIECLILRSSKQIRDMSYDDFKRTINKANCTKGLKDLLMSMVSVNPLIRPTYDEIVQETKRLARINLDSKLNQSMRRKPQNVLSTSYTRKTQEDSNSKLKDQQEIITRRTKRQRNLLSELYTPKKGI